jgi:hypothetical protein
MEAVCSSETLVGPHGVTTRMTNINIYTAVRTSDLTVPVSHASFIKESKCYSWLHDNISLLQALFSPVMKALQSEMICYIQPNETV